MPKLPFLLLGGAAAVGVRIRKMQKEAPSRKPRRPRPKRQSIRRNIVKPYLRRSGELPAWFVDPAIEQMVEGAVEHGEQNSHLTLAPQAIRDILNRISARIASAETPAAVVTSSGARYYLRQIVEPTMPT